VLPLPVHWRWSLQASPTARHSANTARPQLRAGISRDMPVYSSSLVGCVAQLVERRSLTGELSLSCARPAADG